MKRVTWLCIWSTFAALWLVKEAKRFQKSRRGRCQSLNLLVITFSPAPAEEGCLLRGALATVYLCFTSKIFYKSEVICSSYSRRLDAVSCIPFDRKFSKLLNDFFTRYDNGFNYFLLNYFWWFLFSLFHLELEVIFFLRVTFGFLSKSG